MYEPGVGYENAAPWFNPVLGVAPGKLQEMLVTVSRCVPTYE